MSRDEAGAIADPKRRIIDPDGQMVSEDMKWINLENHNNEFASDESPKVVKKMPDGSFKVVGKV